jgi:hypothetical protein
MLSLLVTLIVALLAAYLVVRFNGLWVYRWFDRALKNPRTGLEPHDELPRYFRVGAGGALDLAARWPGWDGWYFFVTPQGKDFPVKMIRASIMSGLYGLDGIDDYAALPAGLSSFHAAEYLSMAPALDQTDGRVERNNHLAHSYVPRQRLDMSLKELAVSITAAGGSERRGKIQGRWPEYQFHFRDASTGLECELSYKGQDLVWWADIPGIFTYFAAFGRFTGKLALRPASADAASPAPPEVTYPIEGMGAFEHGFARKPFNFDFAYLPVRLLKKIAPGFRPVRYHYQLIVGEGGLHGGFMYARGFGIEFRNRGGLYVDGQYRELRRVRIEYLESEPGQSAGAGSDRGRVNFPRRWRVRASTEAGDLEFISTHEWPPAQVASNMIYYHHSFEGTYLGNKIQGAGYGEYLSI